MGSWDPVATPDKYWISAPDKPVEMLEQAHTEKGRYPNSIVCLAGTNIVVTMNVSKPTWGFHYILRANKVVLATNTITPATDPWEGVTRHSWQHTEGPTRDTPCLSIPFRE